MVNPLRILLFLSLFFGYSQALKILMYQIAFSPSHMPFSGAIADTLIDRGHVVDKIIAVLNPSVKTNGSKRLRNVYRITRKNEENPFLKLLHFTDPLKVTPDPRHNLDYIAARKVFCEELLNNEELIEKLKNEKYDLYLTTPYDYCGLGLNHALKIPSVSGYTATQSDEYAPKYLGFPRQSYIPFIFDQQVFPKKLNFWHRWKNFLIAVDQYSFDLGIGIDEYGFLKRKFPDFPSPAQLFMRMSYVFRNSNEIIGIQRPESAKVKFIAGIAMSRVKAELTEEVLNILNKPSKGTVVFSFGSLFSTKVLGAEKKLEILKAFSWFPNYTFIWKFDSDDVDLKLLTNFTNVYAVNWLPQVPLLNDDRVRAFITHMGMNSYMEASHAGKPIIGIPIFADQYYNLACATQKGFALYVDKTNVTTESLRGALNQILSVPSYSIKANEISAMLRDRPLSPQDELIQAVEYSAKHPQLFDVLQLDSADMSLWEYYALDVFGAILFVSIFFIVIFIIALKRIVYYLLSKKEIKAKKA